MIKELTKNELVLTNPKEIKNQMDIAADALQLALCLTHEEAFELIKQGRIERGLPISGVN